MKLNIATRLFTYLAIAALAVPAMANDVVPAAPQTQPIALVNGTIHPVSGPVIEKGTVVFDKGKIIAIGADVKVPHSAKKIDLEGKRVYPGLFESLSNIGLIEISAVRASVDSRESGTLNPNAKSWVAVNPDSELIPVARSNGVLLAVSGPSGGLISGQSALLQLDGWTYEDLTLKAPIGMHINWPAALRPSAGQDKDDAKKQRDARDKKLQSLTDLLAAARAYHNARKANASTPVDIRYTSLLPVIAGTVPIIVNADGALEIQEAVSFAASEKLKLIIYGGYDAPYCANLLKQHNVPVIVGGVQRLPRRRWEAYDTPFTVADRLRQAGVQYCISGAARFGASATRNLPYHAAHAAAFGLPPEEALKAITLYPAQILGVADRVGSLEAGKDATLFIADGDILEAPTHVLSAYIQGRELDLTDKHKQLWNKYREKYRRQKGKRAEVTRAR